MNILYLTEFTSAIGGGGEVAFANYAKEMGRRGHNVHIIAHNSVSDNSADGTCPNIHSVRIGPDVNLRHGWFPRYTQQIAYIIHLLVQGGKVIGRRKIQVIHANTMSPAIAGSLLGLIYNIPVVVTVHHVESVQTKRQRIRHHIRSSSRRAAHARYPRLLRLLCERTILSLPLSVVHAVSRSTAADLRKFGYKGKIEVIANGLNIADYDVLPREHMPFLLFVGRLVVQKNLDVVIEAFAKASVTLSSAKLVVVGDGPMRNTWAQLARELGIEDKVLFLGYVSEEMKLELLSKCSALVFPSLIEGFGLAVLEAFAAGKPVLVSDVDSVKELVSDGVNGLIISSPADWESKIKLLLSNASLCRAMGWNGRIRAERYFRLSRVGEKFEKLYYSLIFDTAPEAAAVSKATTLTFYSCT